MILPKQVDFGAETNAIAITDFSGCALLANESSIAPESLSESSVRSHARRAALPSIRYVESRWPNFPSPEDCRHGDHSPWLPQHKHDQILPGTLRVFTTTSSSAAGAPHLCVRIYLACAPLRNLKFSCIGGWNEVTLLSICRRSQSE